MEKSYECCECGWTGSHSEKAVSRTVGSALATDVCPSCEGDSFYEMQASIEGAPSSDAIQFGNWLNRNAEKWGSEWVLENGKNFTTAELYRRFKILNTPIPKNLLD